MNIYDSISSNGYIDDSNNHITVDILADKTEWYAYVDGGNHRVAALSVLGYKTAPVIIRKIVRREDVEHWPNVVNGLYSKEAALKVFDRIFNAEPPPVFNRWLDYCRINRSC